MADYLTLIRREYKERRDIMAEALDRYAPPGLSWNIPAGGYYLWCTLPEGVSAEALAQKAAAGGVAILPGMPSYLVTRKGEAHVRLNYTFPAKTGFPKESGCYVKPSGNYYVCQKKRHGPLKMKSTLSYKEHRHGI